MNRPTISVKKTDVELFGRTLPRSTMSAPDVVCLVCKRTDTPDPARPSICATCGGDLSCARGFVVNMVLASERRAERAADAVDDATQALDPATRARYDAYNHATIAGDPKAEQVDAMARSGRDEPLLNYVRLWLEYIDADAAARDAHAWAASLEEVLS